MTPFETALSERRLWTRQDVTGPGIDPLVATVGLSLHSAVVRDLSVAGLCLLTTQPVGVGCTVPVIVSGSQVGKPHRLLVEIVRCETLDDGLVQIGVRFADEPSVAEGRRLLDSVALPQPAAQAR